MRWRIEAENSSRMYLECLNRAIAQQLPVGSRVLDAGAGSAPYRGLFSEMRYESADFMQVDKSYAEITYVCDLTSIPVEDGRFDLVIFNQTLEHVPEPKLVLRELARVLRPGGRLLYTGPFFYEEHEQPHDYYRYTQYGLKYLISAAGLEIERLEWLEGYLGTLAYQLSTAVRCLPAKSEDFGSGLRGLQLAAVCAAARILFRLLGNFFMRCDLRQKYTARGYPKNYAVVARKPGARVAAGHDTTA